MSCPLRLSVAVMAAALASQSPAPSTRAIDVLRYGLRVTAHRDHLELIARIEAAGNPPEKWSLELAPEMQVTGATCGTRPVPFTRDGRTVVLDGGA